MAIGALDHYSKTSVNSLSVIPNKPAHGFKSLHHIQVRIQIKRYDLVFGQRPLPRQATLFYLAVSLKETIYNKVGWQFSP